MLASCGEPPVVDELHSFGEEGWHMDTAVTSQWIAQDSATPIFMRMYVRHTTDYPYSNLYLFRSITSNVGLVYSDTVNVSLADALGQWNGEGMSNLKTMQVPIGRGAVRFEEGVPYELRIVHGMRDTLLSGITDVGVVLERAVEK